MFDSLLPTSETRFFSVMANPQNSDNDDYSLHDEDSVISSEVELNESKALLGDNEEMDIDNDLNMNYFTPEETTAVISSVPFESTQAYESLCNLLQKLVTIEAENCLEKFDSGFHHDDLKTVRRRQLTCECLKKFKAQLAYRKHKSQCNFKSPQEHRIPCVLGGCNRDFLNLPGIAYHFKNHLHGLSDIVKTRISNNQELLSIIRDIQNIEIPNDFKSSIDIEFKMELPLSGKTITRSIRFDLQCQQIQSVQGDEDTSVSVGNAKKSIIKARQIDLDTQVKESSHSKLDISSFPTPDIINESFQIGSVDEIKIKVKPTSQPVAIKPLESIHGENMTVLNTGLNCTALDFKNDYLIVGGSIPGKFHIEGELISCHNSIQLWKVTDFECELKATISHTFGDVLQMQWCKNSLEGENQIGLLAATFTDGHVRVFVCPFSPVLCHCKLLLKRCSPRKGYTAKARSRNRSPVEL